MESWVGRERSAGAACRWKTPTSDGFGLRWGSSSRIRTTSCSPPRSPKMSPLGRFTWACRRMRGKGGGGRRWRAAGARVLGGEPETRGPGEPPAGLAPRGRRGLIRLLAALPQTMLVSTHDLGMVGELFARTVVLDQGKVAADAPP